MNHSDLSVRHGNETINSEQDTVSQTKEKSSIYGEVTQPLKSNYKGVPPVATKTIAEEIAFFTDTELEIATIWADIMNIPLNTIGTSDTLFGLGGNSHMIGEFMERGFSFLNLSILFQNLSLEKLANVVDSFRTLEQITEAPIPVNHSPKYPLSFEQTNMWNDIQERSRHKHHPMLLIHFTINLEILDDHSLKKSVELVVRRHELLRSQLVVRPEDGIPEWVVHDVTPTGIVDFKSIDLTHLELQIGKDEAMEFERNELTKIVNLESFPLIHFVAFKFQGGGGALKIFTHHIIMDAHSIQLLRQEILKAYESICSDSNAIPQLDEMKIQYGDYSAWQRHRLETNVKFVAKMESYWKTKLANYVPLKLPFVDELELKISCPEEKYLGNFFCHQFPKDLCDMIDSFCKAQATIPFVVFYAGFVTTLQGINGQTDFTILSIAKGRTNKATKNLIGHLMHFIALRTRIDLKSTQGFEALVQSVHDDLMASLEHQDYPYRLLSKDCTGGDQELKNQLENTLVQMLPENLSESTEIERSPGLQTMENQLTNVASELFIMFEALRKGEGYLLMINYRKARFETKHIEQLVEKLSRVLWNGIMFSNEPIQRISN